MGKRCWPSHKCGREGDHASRDRLRLGRSWALRLSAAERLVIPWVPAGPGIYRFRVSNASETEVYIGESQNLRQRMMGNYASTHTGKMNVRIRKIVLGHLA